MNLGKPFLPWSFGLLLCLSWERTFGDEWNGVFYGPYVLAATQASVEALKGTRCTNWRGVILSSSGTGLFAPFVPAAMGFVSLGPFHCAYIHFCICIIACMCSIVTWRGGPGGTEAYP